MFSFFRRKPKPQPAPVPVSVPDWANFLSPENYHSFLTAVNAYFKSLGNPYTIDDGVVHTKWMDNGMGIQNMGLLNVAQMCGRSLPAEHGDIVRNHFEMMRKSENFMEVFVNQINDFEFVRSFIGTRLYHPDHLSGQLKDKVIHKSVADGIIAMLVFDLPQTIMSVQTDQLAVWGMTAEELFEIGIHNIRENYNFEVVDLDAGVPLKAVVQDHFFGGNILFELERAPALLGTHGTLVAVPHRHTTMLFPIEDESMLLALQALIPMTNGMFNEGPGSISQDIYWYHQGLFECIPYEISADGVVTISPPDSYSALLNYICKD